MYKLSQIDFDALSSALSKVAGIAEQMQQSMPAYEQQVADPYSYAATGAGIAGLGGIGAQAAGLVERPWLRKLLGAAGALGTGAGIGLGAEYLSRGMRAEEQAKRDLADIYTDISTGFDMQGMDPETQQQLYNKALEIGDYLGKQSSLGSVITKVAILKQSSMAGREGVIRRMVGRMAPKLERSGAGSAAQAMAHNTADVDETVGRWIRGSKAIANEIPGRSPLVDPKTIETILTMANTRMDRLSPAQRGFIQRLHEAEVPLK